MSSERRAGPARTSDDVPITSADLWVRLSAWDSPSQMALPPKSHASKPKRRFIEKAKPTAEEIQLRQAWKEQRRVAREAGLAEPPKPLLAYEYGGSLDKVPKAVRDRYEKMQAAYERGDKAKPQQKGTSTAAAAAGGAKQGKAGKGRGGAKKVEAAAAAGTPTGPSPKAAKRKEKKERRKSESAAQEMLPEV